MCPSYFGSLHFSCLLDNRKYFQNAVFQTFYSFIYLTTTTHSHHRRSSGSTTPSSLSVSPRSSAHGNSPAVSPGRVIQSSVTTTTTSTSTNSRTTSATKASSRTTVSTVRSRRVDINLDLSDSEPEFELFPWVDVSDDELSLPDE